MKKKLLLITGAGASIDFGMPSVKEIDSLFDNWLLGELEIDGSNMTLYKYLQDRIDAYYMSRDKIGMKKCTNYEEVLYTSMQLSSILTNYKKTPLNVFVKLETFPKIKKFTESKNIEGHDFSLMVGYVVDKLLEDFRGRCLMVQQNYKNEFDALKGLLDKLNDEFEIGIVTLNYDNVILQAKPDLKTGFSPTGDFSPDEIIRSNDWRFCYHLHGSVHFDMQGDKIDMHQIKWNYDLNSKFENNSMGRNYQFTNEGIDAITSNIIAGYNKTNQILRYPFSLYYSDMIRKINEADGFIFIGYGFNDYHLNHAFRESLIRNRKRPVVIIDYADNNTDCLQFNSGNWTYHLCYTIPVNTYEVGIRNKSIPPSMQQLKQNNLMEVSNDLDYPLALWYNGLLGICSHYDVLRNELPF